MRFHRGAPPIVADFHPETTGWKPLKEPGPIGLQLMALPIGIATVAVLIWIWNAAMPNLFDMSWIFSETAPPELELGLINLGVILIGFVAFVFVHELLHAIVTPEYGLTDQTLIAIWPSKLLAYAAYIGPISRERFLVLFAMPFFVLSVLPIPMTWLIGLKSPIIASISVFNGLCSCGDALGFLMVMFQVPRGAQVQNQGWATWWKFIDPNVCVIESNQES